MEPLPDTPTPPRRHSADLHDALRAEHRLALLEWSVEVRQLEVQSRRLDIDAKRADVQAKREAIRTTRHARVRADIRLAMMIVIAAAGYVVGVPGAVIELIRAVAQG